MQTLGELFDQLNVQYALFDMGRQITPLDKELFARIEQQQRPYPTPYLRQAWLSVLLWENEQPQSTLLWFIRLPLDEQGMLNRDDRDQFLQQLLVAFSQNLQASESDQQLASVLKGNPYVFEPRPERQASMHAIARRALGLPPSQHHQEALAYLSGDLSHWQNLAIQGLADVCLRWEEHEILLAKVLPLLPDEPLEHLCLCLENATINARLTVPLVERLQQVLAASGDTPHPATRLLSALIRALSNSIAIELRHSALQQVLAHPLAQTADVLAALVSRCQWDLSETALGHAFLEALSQQPQEVFDRLLGELLFDQRLRPHLLPLLQAGNHSPQLAMAVATFLSGTRDQTRLH